MVSRVCLSNAGLFAHVDSQIASESYSEHSQCLFEKIPIHWLQVTLSAAWFLMVPHDSVRTLNFGRCFDLLLYKSMHPPGNSQADQGDSQDHPAIRGKE